MHELRDHGIQCPYCWEIFEIVIDCSVPHQRYVEDCEVCCRPIVLDVVVDESGEVVVMAENEDD